MPETPDPYGELEGAMASAEVWAALQRVTAERDALAAEKTRLDTALGEKTRLAATLARDRAHLDAECADLRRQLADLRASQRDDHDDEEGS